MSRANLVPNVWYGDIWSNASTLVMPSERDHCREGFQQNPVVGQDSAEESPNR